MSWDVKYRPRTFEDVLGQENTVKILRQFIKTGTGAHHSYLFAGPHGCGKTTLGRIMARALLCLDPQDGNPCDRCISCQSILEKGSSPDFVEVDAATNSGKDDVRKIVESVDYTGFTGRRMLYLLDESHNLSKQALDALLKPLEDNIPGSQEKKLLCIFCTTEPDKMRATILSRCAPAFFIEPLDPYTIAKRLAFICESEEIEYEEEILPVIAQTTQSHVRDAIKAVEAIARTGAVTREGAMQYLHLDLNGLYVDLLLSLVRDVGGSLSLLGKLLKRVSPVACYARLADVCLLAYQVSNGVEDLPPFWNREKLEELGSIYGSSLLNVALHFSERPGRPTRSMLVSDLMLISDSIVNGRSIGGSQTISSAPRINVSYSPPMGAEYRPVEEQDDSPPPWEDRRLASDEEIVKDSGQLPLREVAPSFKRNRSRRTRTRNSVEVKDGKTPNGVFVGGLPVVERKTKRRYNSGRVSPQGQQGFSDGSAARLLETMVIEQGTDGCVSSDLAAGVLETMVSELAKGPLR